VKYLRVAHDPRPIFKLHEKESFVDEIEVPAKRYLLKLSEIPDRTKHHTIYGFIDMESEDYYKKTENGDSHLRKDSSETKQKSIFRFYFKSEYRKYDFSD
jgi:hypothetical protein